MPRKSAAVAKSLTDRDQSILSDIARCRVLSTEQIHRAYWGNAKERTCSDRLSQLEKGGYISRQTVPGEKPGIAVEVYHLSKKGRTWATSPEGPGIDKKMIFTTAGKIDEVIHQVRTNDHYFTLSERERQTWKIGDVVEKEKHVYKGRADEIPDASYVSDDGEETYVETDVGKYTGKQIRNKVASFAGKTTKWICPKGREKTLRANGVTGSVTTYTTRGAT